MPPSKFQALGTPPAVSFRVMEQTSKSSSKRERAKFDPQRRLEVKAVRDRRACLRCSLLKIKVSLHHLLV
jgi:hypothetical protein